MEPQELLNQITRFLSSGRVKKLCRSYHAEVEDAACELYVRLTEKAEKEEKIHDPRAWINGNGIGFLRNWLQREVEPLANTIKRKLRSSPESSAPVDCALIDEGTAKNREVLDAHAILVQKEIREYVATKLDPMPGRMKEGVEARLKVSGESCRQVARRHGVAPGTVLNWAKAGIAKLRVRLEDCL